MGSFVLQNKNRQTVRTFRWESPSLTLVYRQDQGRIEAVSSEKELKDQDIPYVVLVKTTQEAVQKRAITIGNFGYLKYQKRAGEFTPTYDLVEEEEDVLKKSLKWSAIFHVSTVILLMLISFIAARFFTEDPQKPVVINVPKLEQPVAKKVAKVAPSKKKIKRTRSKAKASNVTKKARPKVTRIKKQKVRKNIPANKKGPNINKMGALGALSAAKKSSSSSLNLNGVGSGRGGKGSNGRGYGGSGSSGGGLGEGLSGGASGALPGKGLIASSPGSGSRASGAGGYGGSGAGGGRNSKGGAVSFRGKSGGFMTSLASEATVESGLDRDQIAAVVQKNMGQIIYCYEMGLQGKPSLRGRLTADWVINGSGRVSRSNISHSSLGDSKVEKCIARKIKGWKFPRPVGGVNVDVSYPFELRRVSQVSRR